jgi:hypothetical protein
VLSLISSAQRQRTDDNEGIRGFFKPSMLEDPWAHLS